MDDGFIFGLKHLDFEYFSICLNNLHPAVKCTFKKPKLIQNNHSPTLPSIELFRFWSCLHYDNICETDIYYKDSNANDYLPYKNAHPKPCKENLSYNLAKRIIVFVSNDKRLYEIRWIEKSVKGLYLPINVKWVAMFNAIYLSYMSNSKF